MATTVVEEKVMHLLALCIAVMRSMDGMEVIFVAPHFGETILIRFRLIGIGG